MKRIIMITMKQQDSNLMSQKMLFLVLVINKDNQQRLFQQRTSDDTESTRETLEIDIHLIIATIIQIWE